MLEGSLGTTVVTRNSGDKPLSRELSDLATRGLNAPSGRAVVLPEPHAHRTGLRVARL